jgi:ParB family chromosome partitioning protein
MGGQHQAKQRRPAVRQTVAPALTELADLLSDALETRVRVEQGQRKGKIVVEFASLEDLQRIIATMSPEWAQSLTA